MGNAQPPASRDSVWTRIVFGVGGAVVALIGQNAFWPVANNVIDRVWPDQDKRFQAAYSDMLKAMDLKPPDYDLDRVQVGAAYDIASKPHWKCQVVHAVINRGDETITIKITPIGVYDDYRHGSLPQECSDDINALGKLIEKTPRFAPYHATSAAADTNATNLRTVADAVIAKGTQAGTRGWIYIGRADAAGRLSDERMIVEPSVGADVTAKRDLPIEDAPPRSAGGEAGNSVGRAAAGSTFQVFETRALQEPVQPGAPGSAYIWANVELKEPGKGNVSAAPAKFHRTRARRTFARASNGVAAVTACPPFAQTNSRHGPTQRWVYAGQKVDSSNAFISGTSRLDTSCVPRDGAVVRVTQSLKVYVGADPHWPGVRANGQAVTPGSSVQVVGDVSGYPFDATRNPGFCDSDPIPAKSYQAIPRGHEKRYCVYIPFVPL